MPVLIAVLRDGTPEGKRGATEELMTLARSVDRQNEENRLARQKAIGNAIEGKGVES